MITITGRFLFTWVAICLLTLSVVFLFQRLVPPVLPILVVFIFLSRLIGQLENLGQPLHKLNRFILLGSMVLLFLSTLFFMAYQA